MVTIEFEYCKWEVMGISDGKLLLSLISGNSGGYSNISRKIYRRYREQFIVVSRLGEKKHLNVSKQLNEFCEKYITKEDE